MLQCRPVGSAAEPNRIMLVVNVVFVAGKSPFGQENGDDHLGLGSDSLDQTVPSLGSPGRAGSPTSQISGSHTERYSRKVFVGGLPPDIDEGQFKVNHLFSNATFV